MWDVFWRLFWWIFYVLFLFFHFCLFKSSEGCIKEFKGLNGGLLQYRNSRTEPWCSRYRFRTPQVSHPSHPLFSILLPVPPVFPPYWPHTADCQQVGQHHPWSMRSCLLPQNSSRSTSVLKLITNEASDLAVHPLQISASCASY